jgi:hypothetical protein
MIFSRFLKRNFRVNFFPSEKPCKRLTETASLLLPTR